MCFDQATRRRWNISCSCDVRGIAKGGLWLNNFPSIFMFIGREGNLLALYLPPNYRCSGSLNHLLYCTILRASIGYAQAHRANKHRAAFLGGESSGNQVLATLNAALLQFSYGNRFFIARFAIGHLPGQNFTDTKNHKFQQF